MPEILTLDEAASLAGCGVDTLKDLLTRGDLDALRVGRDWSIPREAFVASLNRYAGLQSEARRGARKPAEPEVQANPLPQPRRRPLVSFPQAVS